MYSLGKSKTSPRSTPRDGSDLSSRMSDWMRAVTSPTPYRVGTAFTLNTYRVAQCGIIMLLVLTGLVLLIPVFFYPPSFPSSSHVLSTRYRSFPEYNATYPLSPPMRSADRNSITYRIGAVADLDTDSKSEKKKDTWVSFLKLGHLAISSDMHKVSIEWDNDEVTLESGLSLSGRGMELSELTAFNGRLYTCDDRTGTVFEITRPHYRMIPWVMLSDGDGKQTKGFKCEWMAVRDTILWVGGLGKEWTTTTGVVQNLHPQWVKSIGHIGDVRHHSWVDQFNALRLKAGCDPPGYMIHESAAWSTARGQWVFLPRRASKDTYNEKDDEQRATNIMLLTDDTFTDITLKNVGPLHHTHGFSAFRFIPETDDRLIVALKSEEDAGKIATYITVIDIDNGQILLNETKIGDHKYEGIEFI